MVEKVVCEQCGRETNHPIKKEFDCRIVNFCCHGCLGVYELDREEKLLNQAPAGQEDQKKDIQNKK